MTTSMAENDIIKFVRRHDYRFVKELGQGGCGKTVLLHDDQIDEDFVCKKFTPYSEGDRAALFANFVREIKILHKVYHANVVRVFNYYIYPASLTGFILMEYVEGAEVDKFLSSAPEKVNEVFIQTISGFRYLETHGILHRDIRPGNLLVGANGSVKIIDFGFGKLVRDSKDFDKSVSLNWWCEPPAEFTSSVYNFQTEVYFVGKMFERIIQENQVDEFKYGSLLMQMCEHSPLRRIQGFAAIEKSIQSDMFFEIGFGEEDTARYRAFADAMERHLTKLENRAKYQEDVERIQVGLENAYRGFMLEETVPDSASVTRCLIEGAYYYRKKGFPVSVVKDFLHLLKSSSTERRRIILANLQTRLDAITRYDADTEGTNNLPF